MTFPQDPWPVLDADRLARRKDHLMIEISTLSPAVPATEPVRARPRRRRLVWAAAATTAVLAGGAGTTALAGGFTVTRQPDGLVMIDLNNVVGVYQGRVVSLDEVKDLNEQGKARVSIANGELACQGIMLYVDTTTEADEYGRGYTQRQQARAQAAKASPSASSDPCAIYSDAPRFAPATVPAPAVRR